MTGVWDRIIRFSCFSFLLYENYAKEHNLRVVPSCGSWRTSSESNLSKLDMRVYICSICVYVVYVCMYAYEVKTERERDDMCDMCADVTVD